MQFSFDSSYYGGEEYHGSVTIQLPNIPRKTGVSAGAVDLGKAMTITLTPAVATFQSSISYKCGSASGTVSGWSTNTKVTWTPPLTLANQVTNAARVPIVLTVTTRNASGATVCTVTYTVNCTIPASMAPTVTVALSDKKGYTAKYGGYIQSKSQLQAAVTAAGAYGATISGITVKCGTTTGTGATTIFSLPASGTVTVTVTVKDSRGIVTVKNQNISVLAYKKPSISVAKLNRCDASGNLLPTGSYAQAQITASVPAMGNLNGTQYALKWRKVGASTWSSKTVPNSAGLYKLTNAPCLFAAGIDDRYECKAAVTDDFGTTESQALILSVAHALLDMDRNTKAVGIGQRANTPETLSIGMDMRLFDHRITELGTPVEAGDAVPKGYADQGMHSRNLLDNGWFTVNQRGINTAAIAPGDQNIYGYLADRWIIRTDTAESGTARFTLGNGLTITANGAPYTTALQVVDPGINLPGKTVTLSALIDSNTYSGAVQIGMTDASEGGAAPLGDWIASEYKTGVTGLLSVTFAVPASYTVLKAMVRLRGTGTGSVRIRAMKLELGSISTLAQDAPPDTVEETGKCQRYFYRCYGTFLIPAYVNAQGTTLYADMQTPVHMASLPSVSVTGTVYARGSAGAKTQTGTITAYSAYENHVLLQMAFADTSVIPANSAGLLAFSGAILQLTADL